MEQRLQQKNVKKISAQQQQLVKILHKSDADFAAYIEDFVTKNPALEVEERAEERFWGAAAKPFIPSRSIEKKYWETDRPQPLSIDEQITNQLGYVFQDPKSYAIARYITGNLDQYGYFKIPIEHVVEELELEEKITTTSSVVKKVLHKVQQLEPAGIAATNLAEALCLQLERLPQEERVKLAQQILKKYFSELKEKKYQFIATQINKKLTQVMRAIETIRKLTPYPLVLLEDQKDRSSIYQPDLIVTTDSGGKTEVRLVKYWSKNLKLSKRYLQRAEEVLDPPTKKFLQKHIQEGRLLLHAIAQREDTLERIMKAIIKLQNDFFVSAGDKEALHPLYLRDVATFIGVHVSTISRAIHGKVVQTDFGSYPLRDFFIDGIMTKSGRAISHQKVKKILLQLIQEEEKQKPYNDKKLEALLREKGITIARRTVAKYRNLLGIANARHRRLDT